MFKKTLFILFLAFVGCGKLFAQSFNPPIHVPALPCEYTICLVAMDNCKQIACGPPQCVTVPPNTPGTYYANPITACLAGAKKGCVYWHVSFAVGPCEGIQGDAPTDFVVKQGTATGWTVIGTGQNYEFMWDGSAFHLQQ